ncbi:MAG: uroporphyrinogen decarboxylase family protein [Kiritimatiellae bacterium]|nr:uroporphyrinogen decarboxylase family protein [Kiritimatiellia bacterium]
MNGRERIEAALAHREADRIPVDLGASESSGIHGIAYNRLKGSMGLKGGKTQIYDLSQMIAKVEPLVLDKIGADAVPLLIEPRAWKPWRLQDGSPCEMPAKANLQSDASGTKLIADDGTVVADCPAGSYYFDTCYHALADAASPADIEAGITHLQNFDWPVFCDEDYINLRQKARDLYEKTDRAVVGNLWVHVFAAGQILRGFENFMMDLLADKPLAHALMGRLVDCYAERVRRYVKAVGEYCTVIQVNDDLGTQNGLQIAPATYREMIKPYHARLWGLIKKLSGKPLLLHSCGSVYELIPDLIEIGIDAINPVQVRAANMDSKNLKREFGKDLTFWGGGCDTQQILGNGTVADIKKEVCRRCADLAPGGGFVFCQVHNIQPNVPPENITAMYAAIPG